MKDKKKKYKIVRNMFFDVHDDIVAKNLDKITAEKLSNKYNKQCDIYTWYTVERM